MPELQKINPVENIPQNNNLENEKSPESNPENEKSPESFKESNAAENDNAQNIQAKSDDLKKEETVSTGSISFQDKALEKKIESILEKDLEELYMSMPDDKKQEFKEKGEETAGKINVLLKGVKIQVGKIINLIADWLNIIPRVNKFFIKQTAKIKTDEILDLSSKEIKNKK